MTEPTTSENAVVAAATDRTAMLERALNFKPPPHRWSRWPFCVIRRHPVQPGDYCSCRAIVCFRIDRG